MTKKQLELTTGEWKIIRAVWENEPCAAPTIQEILENETGWSYSTVKTMMDRMVDKSLLVTQRIRNLILYSSAITKKEAQKGEIMRAVRRAFDGAMTPMMQFLLENHSLSVNEVAQLEEILRKNRKKKTKGEA
jgi:BlaI family penicillinase repressor